MNYEGLKLYDRIINVTLKDEQLNDELTYDEVMLLQDELVSLKPHIFDNLLGNKFSIEDYNGRQLREINRFIKKGLDISTIVKPQHSSEFLANIFDGAKENLTMVKLQKYLNDIKYLNSQAIHNREELDKDLVEKTMQPYIESNDYTKEQLEAIRFGVTKGIKTKFYDSPKLTPQEMRKTIRAVSMGIPSSALVNTTDEIFDLIDTAIYNDVKEEFLKVFFVYQNMYFLEQYLKALVDNNVAKKLELKSARYVYGYCKTNHLGCDSLTNLIDNYSTEKINLILAIVKKGYDFKDNMSPDISIEALQDILNSLG